MFLFVYSGQVTQGDNMIAPEEFSFSFDFIDNGDIALQRSRCCRGVIF